MNKNIVKVVCPNGHRFPVNLDKHQDRNYRFCPTCKAKVKVTQSILKWSPDVRWARIKEERESARREEKEQKRVEKRQGHGPPPFLFSV